MGYLNTKRRGTNEGSYPHLFYFCCDRASLPFTAGISKEIKGGWHEKLSRSGKPRLPPSIPLFSFFYPHPPACPSLIPLPPLHARLCIMNSSADKADLSFCHEGREGRQTVECPGTESREGL